MSELPVITEKILEEFGDTSLITYDLKEKRLEWTQIAVDFACLIDKGQCKAVLKK